MIYIIGHKNPDTDSVISAIAYSLFKGDKYKPLIAGKLNSETTFVLKKFGFKVPKICDIIDNNKFILVDHNEESQRIDGLTSDKIIEIIDHHKINFQNNSPIEILIKPYGSTASIIAEKFFKEKKEKITKKIASILICAILSDTIIFKSPTATDKDKELAIKLAKISKIDNLETLGIELFNKKAEIVLRSPKEIINSDFKDFIFNNKKVGIGQLKLTDLRDIRKKKNQIIKEMKKTLNRENYFSIILIITDIFKKGSEFLIVGGRKKMEQVFKKKLKNNSFWVQGLMSRKQQIVSLLEKFL